MADVPPDGRNPGFSLRLVGLNSAVASDGSGEESGLWVHHAQLAKVLADAPSDGAVTLTLLHHAPDRDLDARDGETLALLYAQSRLVLHGHYHEFGGVPAAPGRPPMLRMPALGHPQPKEGIDPNLRDGCAVIRVLRDRVQAFFLSHRQPENFGTMAAVYDHAPDGTPMPTCELSYSPGGTIHKVGP